MRAELIFFALLAASAVLPLARDVEIAPKAAAVIQWPKYFDGRPLAELALSQREQVFARDFPGAIARFSDGQREIILRRVLRPTRQLHPSSDCFKAAGFSIEMQPMLRDGANVHWGCFKAMKNGTRLSVCERVYDDSGKSYSDVSTWFWAAALGRTEGPWWAATVASPA